MCSIQMVQSCVGLEWMNDHIRLLDTFDSTNKKYINNIFLVFITGQFNTNMLVI